MTAPDEPASMSVQPDGSTIDLAFVHAVATELNRAHRSMGTQLVAVERRGATIALPWRDDLAELDGGLAPGVIAALFDHACSLAALLSLDDPARFGTTMSVRVDYLEAAQPRRAVRVRAEALHEGPQVLSVRGTAFHAEDDRRPIATAVCTVATTR
jgi:acyl-coenzyme A thioesterase PaaI-like protein